VIDLLDVRIPVTHLMSQSPGHEQALAPGHEQALAARIFHPNRHAIAAKVFHLNHHVIWQSLAPDRFSSERR
jgi:hypothetical protein